MTFEFGGTAISARHENTQLSARELREEQLTRRGNGIQHLLNWKWDFRSAGFGIELVQQGPVCVVQTYRH
jgi:hypothetical protein